MPVADIVIALAIIVSVVIGFVRGFVKEAISIATLLIAVWAAMHFGLQAGTLSESWLSSDELQVWFGRVLLFTVILALGGLISWGVSRLVRLSVLSGTDRVFGMMFGFCRGVVLLAVFIIAGQFANFNNDPWYQKSVLIPYGEVVADWLRVMAPKGADILLPAD
jgi:membrane protein required for colicin V production